MAVLTLLGVEFPNESGQFGGFRLFDPDSLGDTGCVDCPYVVDQYQLPTWFPVDSAFELRRKLVVKRVEFQFDLIFDL